MNDASIGPLVIEVPKEFSFKQNLDYLAMTTDERLYEIGPDWIVRAIPVNGRNFLVKITEEPDEGLLAEFLEEDNLPVGDDHLELARYIRHWFDLDTDLAPFYQMAEKDPLLGEAVKTYYGLRNVGIPDFFEAICWGILGQQINLTFAYTLKRRFVETFGQAVHWEGHDYWVFPRPEDIAGLSVEDLTPLQLSARKSEYLIGVANEIVEGRLLEEKVAEAGSLDEAEKVLTRMRGIGPWTANYVLMRCLRFPDAFPIADVGLHNAIKLVTGSDRKPSLEEIREHALPWKGFEAYATFYLWRCL